MNRVMNRSLVIVYLALLWAQPARADVITDWNASASRAAIASCLIDSENGPAESRMYAIAHVAMHDALNAIDRRSRPYAFDAAANAPASIDAAVSAAAHDALVGVIAELQESPACVAAGIASVDADYAAALAAIPASPAKTLGIVVGEAAAAAILALRANDGSDQLLLDFNYQEGTEPGEWRFTPGIPFAFAPNWGTVTPFVLADGSQYRPRPPYRLKSKKYAADVNEVKLLGGDDVTTQSSRTPDQTQIGLFWVESSPTAWNRIARAVSASRKLALWENARLFGLLNMAMADGYVASWDAKYHYKFWRPITAIQLADTDGNPDTEADPTWTPLHFTYPIPDYDSGHAVQGGVAAEVLKQLFGDDVAFSACSMTLPAGSRCNDASPVIRLYQSFSQAATDNALSRIYIGIHFRLAVEEGTAHGRKIGKRATNLFMKPVQ